MCCLCGNLIAKVFKTSASNMKNFGVHRSSSCGQYFFNFYSSMGTQTLVWLAVIVILGGSIQNGKFHLFHFQKFLKIFPIGFNGFYAEPFYCLIVHGQKKKQNQMQIFLSPKISFFILCIFF